MAIAQMKRDPVAWLYPFEQKAGRQAIDFSSELLVGPTLGALDEGSCSRWRNHVDAPSTVGPFVGGQFGKSILLLRHYPPQF